MVIRITWGKLRAGAWNDFERTYRENVLTKGKGLKGLRGRWLAQDSGDKDTGFAVSLWENPADMKAYEDRARSTARSWRRCSRSSWASTRRIAATSSTPTWASSPRPWPARQVDAAPGGHAVGRRRISCMCAVTGSR